MIKSFVCCKCDKQCIPSIDKGHFNFHSEQGTTQLYSYTCHGCLVRQIKRRNKKQDIVVTKQMLNDISTKTEQVNKSLSLEEEIALLKRRVNSLEQDRDKLYFKLKELSDE